jgi:hypothetical protein
MASKRKPQPLDNGPTKIAKVETNDPIFNEIDYRINADCADDVSDLLVSPTNVLEYEIESDYMSDSDIEFSLCCFCGEPCNPCQQAHSYCFKNY